MQNTREEQSRNNSAALGQGPGSSSKNIHNNIFEFFCRNQGPTQVEDGNFRLGTRFLEHHPVISPPNNLKKITHPVDLTPDSAYEKFSLKTTGNSEFLNRSHLFSLHGSVINPALLQTPGFQFSLTVCRTPKLAFGNCVIC